MPLGDIFICYVDRKLVNKGKFYKNFKTISPSKFLHVLDCHIFWPLMSQQAILDHSDTITVPVKVCYVRTPSLIPMLTRTPNVD